ncbi:hypothetical protein [Roseixanthobacter glucoisosaccharinicivorans]|uniref:hypothetical protein n=1 Tax=Roseixanthobacter glucoisosaccharinicivorans TaxID=3119923 RepID=UPI003726487A
MEQQQQQTSSDLFLGNVRTTVDAAAQQLKETNQATLEASRAVFEAHAQASNVLRGRADRAFRAGLAGMTANRDHLNRLVEAKSLQDVVRLQMLWGANQTIAIFHELNKLGEEATATRSS